VEHEAEDQIRAGEKGVLLVTCPGCEPHLDTIIYFRGDYRPPAAYECPCGKSVRVRWETPQDGRE
jgi:hypothetical protein